MARRLVLLALLPLAAGGVWLYGRAPSSTVLADLVDRFHTDRAARYAALAARRDAAAPGPARETLSRRVEELLAETHGTRVRGWEVRILPAGAPRPDPAGWLRALSRAAPRAEDPPPLRGAYEVWIAPRGAVARLVQGLSGQ